MKTRFAPIALAIAALTLAAGAQAQEKVKIGFVTDMSSLYSDLEGKNGALAIQMAIDDFGGKVLGQPIELMTADHQNKPDIAATKAREWIDTAGLTMVFGGTNSGAALAMAKVAHDAGFKKVAVMYLNNPYGQGLSQEFATGFKQLGGTVTENVVYNPSQPSYRAEVGKAMSPTPDALFLIGYPGDGTTITREWIGAGGPQVAHVDIDGAMPGGEAGGGRFQHRGDEAAMIGGQRPRADQRQV